MLILVAALVMYSSGHSVIVGDLTLLALTPYAMREITQICSDYANEHDVIFSAKKVSAYSFFPRVSTCLSLSLVVSSM
jgi:hypothetical protein